MKKWEILESEMVFNERWYKVRKDKVLLPDGAVIPDFFVALRPDYINVLPICENGDVLLVRQYRHALDKFMLELPAGIVDPNEDPIVAVARELLEETGYVAEKIVPLGTFHENSAKSANTTYSYLATGMRDTGVVERETTEQGMEVVRMPMKEFLEEIRTGGINSEPGLGSTLLGLMTLGYIKL